jgi:hypothetical protein
VSSTTSPFPSPIPVSSQDTQIADPDVDTTEITEVDKPWIVLVWNDPINLMSYVSFVFQKLFGYSKEKADAIMGHFNSGLISKDERHRQTIEIWHGAKAELEKLMPLNLRLKCPSFHPFFRLLYS